MTPGAGNGDPLLQYRLPPIEANDPRHIGGEHFPIIGHDPQVIQHQVGLTDFFDELSLGGLSRDNEI